MNINYEYKVTVIVPVYNAEEYLTECLDSLVEQTINKDELEVLLIDDGSVDSSLELCRKYEEWYPFFKVFHKENSGVSSTRNFGIKNAKGLYLMFLDADDMLESRTIKNVVDFFDANYEKTDVVTYKEITTINGVKQKEHFRFNFLKKTGVYDLNKYPFAVQTRVSICTKNLLDNNILFDETMSYHEDQKYIAKLLENKLTMGFCAEAAYFWRRNDGGIMKNDSTPIKVFETATGLWEEIFDRYEEVPKYYQAMFMHDINWKIRENIFFPYHYDTEEFNHAMDRICALLKKVDVDVIRNHPAIDRFHVYYYLRFKKTPLTGIADKDSIRIFWKDKCIYSRKDVEIVVNYIKIVDGKLKFDGFLKSPIFDFLEKPLLKLLITESDESIREIDVDLFDSAGGYYKSKTKTNLYWGFVIEEKIKDSCRVDFIVLIDGCPLNVCYWFMDSCSMSKKTPVILSKDYSITLKGISFHIEKTNKLTYAENLTLAQKELLKESSFPLQLLSEYHDKKIWLYYDCSGVEKDNGYYQFCNDIKKDDGITRFYIYANGIAEHKYLFEGFKESVIEFGSTIHKLLFLASDRIITAYIEDKNINPFANDEYSLVKRFVNHQVVYLQHGILHAHLPWKYAPGRIGADRIVVSSNYELENFHNTYHFPEYMLVPSGMSRFEIIDKNCPQTEKILFAPSWRNHLIGAAVGNKWTLTESAFLSSDYFKGINSFLNNRQLETILEKYGLTLDFKIHPIFVPYLPLFENTNERVNFITEQIKEEEYKIVITDFSSFIFDFVYLKRPIIYYVPDYTDFKAGMNQYWELDIPFDKAFGKLVLTENALIKEIEKICINGFEAEEIYKERAQGFFIENSSCTEELYKYLSKQ